MRLSCASSGLPSTETETASSLEMRLKTLLEECSVIGSTQFLGATSSLANSSQSWTKTTMDGLATRNSWRGPATNQTCSIKSPWKGPLTLLTQTVMARLTWKKLSTDSATRITKTWRSWLWGKISGLNCSKSLTPRAKTAKSLTSSSSKTCLACSIVNQLFRKNKMNYQKKLHPSSKKKDEPTTTDFKNEKSFIDTNKKT